MCPLGDKEEITNTKALFIPHDPNSTASRQDRHGAVLRALCGVCVCLCKRVSKVQRQVVKNKCPLPSNKLQDQYSTLSIKFCCNIDSIALIKSYLIFNDLSKYSHKFHPSCQKYPHILLDGTLQSLSFPSCSSLMRCSTVRGD